MDDLDLSSAVSSRALVRGHSLGPLTKNRELDARRLNGAHETIFWPGGLQFIVIAVAHADSIEVSYHISEGDLDDMTTPGAPPMIAMPVHSMDICNLALGTAFVPRRPPGDPL